MELVQILIRALAVLFLVGAGCGHPGQNPALPSPPAFLRFQKGIVKKLENAESDFNADQDQDGIPDRMDADLDGDGIPNLADEYPYDALKGAEDSDRDGLPDSVDFEVGGVLKSGMTARGAQFQKGIFDRTRILVVSDSALFSEKELEILNKVLLASPLAHFPRISRNLQVVVKREPLSGFSGSQGTPREFGSFYGYWKTIELEVDLSLDGARFRETWAHELFHVLAESYPRDYGEFLSVAGWTIEEESGGKVFVFRDPGSATGGIRMTEYELRFEMDQYRSKLNLPEFPTEYSKMGPQEMFAECGAAALISLSGEEAPDYRLQEFTKTPLYRWLVSWLIQGEM